MEILKNNILFENLTEKQTDDFLEDTGYDVRDYEKGDMIVRQGEKAGSIGIVLEGECLGIKYTYEGEEIIASYMNENAIFRDVLSGASGYKSPVNVIAKENCRILFIDYQSLIFSENESTRIVLQNMIKNISLKFFNQNFRMDLLMIKNLRSRILTYLIHESEKAGSRTFRLNLDRRLMADYLGADRSALSRELSRMQKEKIIVFHKNEFTLLQ